MSIGQDYHLAPEKSTELAIDGSSTLHAWTASAGKVSGVPSSISIDGESIVIEAFTILTEVVSLDGGRGPSMNEKIQKALKAQTHPEVTFVIGESFSIPISDLPDAGFPVKGELNIAGISHDVELLTTVTIEDKALMISGKRDMKMSDFDIEAPSAMFGQIKTNDDITIRFTVKYITN